MKSKAPEQRKFCIFGQSRSGSTLLQLFLDSHPDIQCDAELLNRDYRYFKNPLVYPFVKIVPVPFMERFRRQSKKPVYGCKILIYQLVNPERTITRLSQEGWKVIHIKRHNIIDQAFSFIIAHKVRYFHRWEGRKESVVNVHVDQKELLEELAKRVKKSDLEQRVFQKIDHLRIIYETELKDAQYWQKTMERIFAYLRVSTAPFEAKISKTYRRPLSEVVVNYYELIRYLEGTSFCEYIQEE